MTWDVATLSDTRIYPEISGELQVLETHISWVVLTGTWAYKLKKPVDFGFLNYTRLEERHRLCLEEVRLNRRTAPDLYVGVVPLCQSEGRLRLEGPGTIVDYAVKMRQFDQSQLLDRRLQEGKLGGRELEQLGRLVAEFHRQAQPARPDSNWGTPESIQGPALDNFDTLLQLEGHHQKVLSPLREWTRARYANLKPVMQQRQLQGFVRELHGDLHLGNVTRWQGQICLFDGIEFAPEFRWIDTFNDLAFLLSDLRHRGRPDLARRALDAYLEESGDYAGLQLLDYYLVYRWMVRAKVAALRKRQAHPELEDEVELYLRQASQFLRKAEPQMILTHGLSGSGKTRLSSTLLESVDFVRLRSDVVRKRLCGLRPGESSGSPLEGGIYTPEQSRRTYGELARQAEMLLRWGYSVVIDATFLRRWQRDLFRELARQIEVPCRLVHLEAPPEVLRQRLGEREARGHDASEAGWETLQRQMLAQDPLQSDEVHVVLSSS